VSLLDAFPSGPFLAGCFFAGLLLSVFSGLLHRALGLSS
jgi:hypothetical protein